MWNSSPKRCIDRARSAPISRTITWRTSWQIHPPEGQRFPSSTQAPETPPGPGQALEGSPNGWCSAVVTTHCMRRTVIVTFVLALTTWVVPEKLTVTTPCPWDWHLCRLDILEGAPAYRRLATASCATFPKFTRQVRQGGRLTKTPQAPMKWWSPNESWAAEEAVREHRRGL